MSGEQDDPRKTFTPMLAPHGHVVHLFDGHWRTICSRLAESMYETFADDPRPTCRTCANGIPWALDLLRYRAEQAAKAERRRTELERRREESEEIQRSIDANMALIREYSRRADLREGRDPNRPRRTADELDAELIALRAENDQLEAEVSGAWRTYD